MYNDLYNTVLVIPHSIIFNAPGAEADWVLDNVIDSQGNIYVAGFNPGNLQGLHQGDGDAYIRKYDATLSNPVTVQFGTEQSDAISKMAKAYDKPFNCSFPIHQAPTRSIKYALALAYKLLSTIT